MLNSSLNLKYVILFYICIISMYFFDFTKSLGSKKSLKKLILLFNKDALNSSKVYS